jgi:hypothetical protein
MLARTLVVDDDLADEVERGGRLGGVEIGVGRAHLAIISMP